VSILGRGLACDVSLGPLDRYAIDAAPLLAPRAARRTTPLTRLAARALAPALEQAETRTVGLVMGSAYGELNMTFQTLELAYERPPASSPFRFRNTVHNTAIGHLSIALKAEGYASAVAASPERIVAMTLLDAVSRVVSTGESLAVVLADEAFVAEDFPGLAVALVLGPAGDGPTGELSRGSGPLPAVPSALSSQPCARAVGLLSAGTVALGEGWLWTATG